MAATAKSIEKTKKEKELREAASLNHLELVNNLISEGVNVDSQGMGSATAKKTLKTALHRAAENNHPEVVKALLLAGANQSIKDINDKTPLDLAIEKKHKEVISLLQTQLLLKDEKNKETFKNEIFVPSLKHKDTEDKILFGIRSLKKQLSKNHDEYLQYHKKYVEVFANNIDCLCKNIFEKECQYIGLNNEECKRIDEVIKAKFSLEGFETHFKFIMIILERKILEMGELIIEKVRMQRALEKSIGNIKSNINLHFKDSKIRKELQKPLNKLIKISQKELLNLELTIEACLGSYFPYPKELIHFLNKYFPEDLIDAATVSTELYLYAAKKKTLDQDDMLVKMNSNIQTVLKQLKIYFDDVKTEILEIASKKKAAAIQWALIEGEDITTIKPESIIQDSLVLPVFNGVYKELFEAPNDPNKIRFPSAIILTVYQRGKAVISNINQVLDNVNSFTIQQFKNKALQMKDQYKLFLENKANSSLNFETIKLQEKSVLLEKEAEMRKAREVEAHKKEEMLYLKKMLVNNESKLKAEKESWVEKLLGTLNIKNDSKTITLMANILDKTEIQILQTDFFALINKLQIPGSEKIQKATENPNGNKVTVNIGKYYSFTLHCVHNKATATMVDKATVAHLRKLFESIDIKKENFWSLVKKYSTYKEKNVI